MTGLRIVSAAIINDLGVIFSLPAPKRHHNIINLLGAPMGMRQGFLTSEGHFVSREEALKIARDANQIVARCGGDDTQLFSENLW